MKFQCNQCNDITEGQTINNDVFCNRCNGLLVYYIDADQLNTKGFSDESNLNNLFSNVN